MPKPLAANARIRGGTSEAAEGRLLPGFVKRVLHTIQDLPTDTTTEPTPDILREREIEHDGRIQVIQQQQARRNKTQRHGYSSEVGGQAPLPYYSIVLYSSPTVLYNSKPTAHEKNYYPVMRINLMRCPGDNAENALKCGGSGDKGSPTAKVHDSRAARGRGPGKGISDQQQC